MKATLMPIVKSQAWSHGALQERYSQNPQSGFPQWSQPWVLITITTWGRRRAGVGGGVVALYKVSVPGPNPENLNASG